MNYRTFSHDVMAAIFLFQNNEMAAALVYHTNPVGLEFFSFMLTLPFVSIKLRGYWPRE